MPNAFKRKRSIFRRSSRAPGPRKSIPTDLARGLPLRWITSTMTTQSTKATVLKLLAWLRIVKDVREPPAWALARHGRASHGVPPARAPAPERSDDDRIDEAGEGSFPASDAPPWTLGGNSSNA